MTLLLQGNVSNWPFLICIIMIITIILLLLLLLLLTTMFSAPRPPFIHIICLPDQHNASFDLWGRPTHWTLVSSCWVIFSPLWRYFQWCTCSTAKNESVEGAGWSERSLPMQRIHFVFPLTADTIFNHLIGFRGTTRHRTLQGVPHFFLVLTGVWTLNFNVCVYFF